MINRVGIRELRQKASAILKRVAAGEVVEVMDHGHPIARIVPLRPSLLDQMVLEGRATEPVGDLLDVMDELGLPLPATPGSQLPSQALEDGPPPSGGPGAGRRARYALRAPSRTSDSSRIS